MTHNQIPSKRNQVGYQGSDAKFDPGRDWANFTADSVQNTSQHENAKEIVTTIVRVNQYAIMFCFSLSNAEWLSKGYDQLGVAQPNRWFHSGT